ncbi:MAG TPA: cupredoxin domain-containing protein [Phenylobacterium sp.]|jgi:hypothetical protein
MRAATLALTTVLATLALGATAAQSATDGPVVVLTLKDHRFSPDAITVPAGKAVRIELLNQDAASEEFDSEDLGVEKDVTPTAGRASPSGR